MSLKLIQQFHQTIAKHGMLRAGDRLGVAVSGGADSVALLRLLHSLRSELGVTLCVAHFNHQLRGSESDDDEAFVASLAKALGLQLFASRANVARLARQNGWNLEDAGRRLRYGFFAELVQQGIATRIATAHTADDQAETVLTRIVRGTGLSGLAAIYPIRGNIIRPLLNVRRAELRHYLAGIQQEWREDPSNRDTRRLRARVRQQLLPHMEQDFSQTIVGRLSALAGLAQDDAAFWSALIEQACTRFVEKTANARSINAQHLLRPLQWAPDCCLGSDDPWRALTQRIIRRLHSEVATRAGELSQKHVEQVIQLAERGESGKTVKLPGSVCVRRELGRLSFAAFSTERQVPSTAGEDLEYSYVIQLPAHGSASISVAELGRQFHLKVIDWPARERETRGAGAVLDTERLRPPLVLRNWKAGDAYRPNGRRSFQKLGDMFSVSRIGRSERSLWPVLTSAGQVIWAAQMPVAAEYSVNDVTQKGLWIFEDDR